MSDEMQQAYDRDYKEKRLLDDADRALRAVVNGPVLLRDVERQEVWHVAGLLQRRAAQLVRRWD